mgnify:CR=1 FL=1
MDLAHYTTGLGCIKKGDIESLKIHIPTLERQKEIVEYCEYNDTLIKQLETEIENNKKQAQEFITGIVKAQVQTEEQSDTSSVVNAEPIDEVQNEIVSVEEKVIIDENFSTANVELGKVEESSGGMKIGSMLKMADGLGVLPGKKGKTKNRSQHFFFLN